LTTTKGTSIGAFIGGLYAREGDLLRTTGRAKQFSGRMGIWRILSDVTYPIVAYTTASPEIFEMAVLFTFVCRDTNSIDLCTK
jgi:lysophospholipid hydrolase